MDNHIILLFFIFLYFLSSRTDSYTDLDEPVFALVYWDILLPFNPEGFLYFDYFYVLLSFFYFFYVIEFY